MSKFLEEIASEIAVRISGYQREKAELQKAAQRIQELDTLISEAQAELDTFVKRLPEDSAVHERLTAFTG